MSERRRIRRQRRAGSGIYLHLGGEVSILAHELVAILDAPSGEKSKKTRRFLQHMATRGAYSDVSGGTVNSYVVTDTHVYACAIAASTLKKRIEAGLIEGAVGLTVPDETA